MDTDRLDQAPAYEGGAERIPEAGDAQEDRGAPWQAVTEQGEPVMIGRVSELPQPNQDPRPRVDEPEPTVISGAEAPGGRPVLISGGRRRRTRRWHLPDVAIDLPLWSALIVVGGMVMLALAVIAAPWPGPWGPSIRWFGVGLIALTLGVTGVKIALAQQARRNRP